ncbi:PAS domain-containing protein [Thalassobaculum sp.]|uniref:PAS domain-containing protein n=1 Tax=Thalassobaculum sp. TaxID=2022740 RepID=UPI0032EC9530
MDERTDWQSTVPANVDPKVRALYEYWDAKRGDAPYPSRADLDPLEIPKLIEHLSLVEVRTTDPRFVYRLVGTSVARALRHDPTGKPVGENARPKERNAVLARYSFVADHGRLIYHSSVLQEKTNDFTTVQRLMLPLGPPSGPPNMILSLVITTD